MYLIRADFILDFIQHYLHIFNFRRDGEDDAVDDAEVGADHGGSGSNSTSDGNNKGANKGPEQEGDSTGTNGTPIAYEVALRAIESMQKQISNSKDESTNKVLKAAIAQIRRGMKQKDPNPLQSILYLVVPYFNGKIIGFGKYGYIRIPWDSVDWVAHIRKHCAERYGTPYKDVAVFM